MINDKNIKDKEIKNKLSREEYFTLIGLMTIAKDHYDKLRDIERSVAQFLGITEDGTDYYGHVSDAIWSGDVGLCTVHSLMKNLKLRLEE